MSVQENFFRSDLSHRLMEHLGVPLVLMFVFITYYINESSSISQFTKMRRSWKEMLQYSNPVSEKVMRGYNRVIKQSGKPFRIWCWSKEYVILPLEYLGDIKRADKDHLDFFRSIADVFYMKYWINDLYETEETDRMVFTVMKGLNPVLNEATQICIDESNDAFLRELGECDTFKSVPTLQAFCGIAHHIAARILVGATLSRDPAFKEASYSYFQGHAITGGLLLYLPLGPLRDLVAKPLSYFQRLRKRRVLSLVAAQFEKRIASTEDQGSQIDGIQFTLKVMKDNPADSGAPLPLFQMSHELIHILGAAHTPVGMTIMQMVWQVLVRPEYLDPLRKEAEKAISQVGFTDRIVEYLPLQDSLIREANRLYPTNAMGMQRLVRGKPFVLHDGLTLPVGTRIAFPTGPYFRDEDVFDKPEEFDAYRYTKLAAADARTESGVNRWAASHAHKDNLTFGYGNHVCPGRFFAVRLMKVIFTKLIIDYDIQSDWKGEGMPPRSELEGSIFPHMSARISLRKRSIVHSDH